MMGIIHCIMRFILAWLEPAVAPLVVLILCKIHMEPPTSTGITMREGSVSPRSSHRKPLFRGTAS